MSIDDCIIIPLKKNIDQRGKLVFIEGNHCVPFDIQRIYYLYDVPAHESRAGHAHKRLQQLIIATSGSFTIHLDDGQQKKSICLDNPTHGLYLCPMIWREIDSFTGHTVCLVLASAHYDEADYYRDYKEFIYAVQLRNTNSILHS